MTTERLGEDAQNFDVQERSAVGVKPKIREPPIAWPGNNHISKSANGSYSVTYARNPGNPTDFAIDLQRPPRFLQPHAIPPITCNPGEGFL